MNYSSQVIIVDEYWNFYLERNQKINSLSFIGWKEDIERYTLDTLKKLDENDFPIEKTFFYK